MFDTARAIIANAIVPRPNLGLLHVEGRQRLSMDHHTYTSGQHHNFKTGHAMSRTSRRRGHVRSASSPAVISGHHDSTTAATRVRTVPYKPRRRVTFAADPPPALKIQTNDPSDGPSFLPGSSRQLRRQEDSVSPSSSDNTLEGSLTDMSMVRIEDESITTQASNYSDNENDNDNSPLQFARIFSPPSASRHVLMQDNHNTYPGSEASDISITEHEPIMLKPQLIHRATGAIFETVTEGPRGVCDNMDHISSQEYILCYCAASERQRTTSVPALSLTIPTPGPPQSPIFAPRSPFSMSKFVAASALSRSVSTSHLPITRRPSTSDGLPTRRFSRGTRTETSVIYSPMPTPLQCRSCSDVIVCSHACRRQWLACAAWYRAHDGGRRQWLIEPYVHPAESTAAVREVVRELGLPVGSSRGLGLTVHKMGKADVIATAQDAKHASSNGGHSGSTATVTLGTAAVHAEGHMSRVSTRRRIWNGFKSFCFKRRPRAGSASSVEIHVSTRREVCV